MCTIFMTCLLIFFLTESFHFKVPENVSVGGEVGRVKVEDIDEPQHRNTKYSFVRGDYRDTFEIVANPYTNEGIIRPKKVLFPVTMKDDDFLFQCVTNV